MIQLNRRILLGSIIAGTALSIAPAALAKVANRYQILIELQRDLYNATDLIYASAPTQRPNVDPVLLRAELRNLMPGFTESVLLRRQMASELKIDDKANALLGFLLSEFVKTDLTDEGTIRPQIRGLFHGTVDIDVMSEDELSLVEDAVVSIAVARHMLSKKKVPLTTANVPNFPIFANRYRHLIL